MGLLRQLALALAMAGAATAAATAQDEAPDPSYYVCRATGSGAFGRIWYSLDVPVDGTAPFHRLRWELPRRAEGLNLNVQSDFWVPVGGVPHDRAVVIVYFRTTKRIRDKVRIEVRSLTDGSRTSQFNEARPYRRLFRWHDTPPHLYTETQVNWGELNAWMSGRDSLTFALVRRDGTVLAEDRLEAATLAGAANAIAAVHPELDAMVADYRNRCEVPEPIIVT